MAFMAKGKFGPEDWASARNEVIENFTHGFPINEDALFAGRQDTVRKLQDTVLESGRHGIIFGERGVWKNIHRECVPSFIEHGNEAFDCH